MKQLSETYETIERVLSADRQLRVFQETQQGALGVSEEARAAFELFDQDGSGKLDDFEVRGALANNRGDQVTGGGGAFFFFNARAGLCRSRRDAGGRSLCITRLCQRRRPRRSLAGCCVLTTLRGGGV